MRKTTHKRTLISVVFAFATLLVGCAKTPQSDIVTTLFPQYDIAKQIAGDKLTVSLMTPFGSEVHGYEPTAKDILRVQNSKLFLYTSDIMERWAANIIKADTNSVNLSKTYSLVPYSHNGAVADNLHYWTDPTTVMQLVNVIKTEIINIDPENAAFYEQNASSYVSAINTVHTNLTNYFNDRLNTTIYFYGHNALSGFAARYNFSIVSLGSSYQPDAELSPGQILALKNQIKAANAHHLFVEELIDLKGPNSLKDELAREGHNLSLLELHGFHNISSLQNERGVTYVDLLNQNLTNLKIALD